MAKVIGIGGCSRSGKSSLALQISDYLPDKKVLLLDMDDFVFPEVNIPKVKDRTDWERPHAVDFDRLCFTIKNQQLNYDIIVVEGILVFAEEKLIELLDITVFIEITRKLFIERRLKETRWGHEPHWFIDHVWNSHLLYGQYQNADFFISGAEKISQKMLFEIASS